jgi:DNA-binding PadR family transcriptional regulator
MSEEIQQKTYSAVEKNGVVTAIWEMVGNKHIRTIDPRSQEGKALLQHYQPREDAPEPEVAANSAMTGF